MNWGIIATGSIAHTFARGVAASQTGELMAVGSRTLAAAESFTSKHAGKPYGSYQEVLDDPEVQAVYIATPHHMHEEWTIKAATAGKAILSEKPFTLNALEASRALAAVEKNHVFFTEAFMYRCHPQTKRVVALIKEGCIGKVLNINAEFGFDAARDWGNFRADGAVGGGGLMDVGTYCVNFARLITGEEPTKAFYSCDITEKGYDAQGSGVLAFPSGITAHFACGIHVRLQNNARIYGEDGWIQVNDPWTCGQSSTVHIHRKGRPDEVLNLGGTSEELYAAEADTFFANRNAGDETWATPRADALNQMKALDALREAAGLRFAAEAL